MKILIYSQLRSEKENIGWYRDGRDIRYYANGIKKDENSSKSLYTLTFIIDFPYDNDTVLIAYCYPYTYTDLIEKLNKIESDERMSEFCIRRTLCRTLVGNRCEYLTITAKEGDRSKRKCVIITGRVHPEIGRASCRERVSSPV